MRSHKLWVVVPAAGAGRRMANGFPKQYQPLLGKTVLEWAVSVFLERDDVAGLVVVLAREDERFAQLRLREDPRISTTAGGAERSASVLAGLRALQTNRLCSDDDWVLVHDAARPCLHGDDLQRLIVTLQSDEIGGLLAAPVTDTLKTSDALNRVAATPSRENMWRALTPQMFRIGTLRRALESRSGHAPTDESAAIELLGLRPKLVAGRADNIKITLPDDLQQAEYILRQRCDNPGERTES
jgi:2-C-methyl-D-erythritol 4-phosphate cytidylyltransferase